MKNTHLLSARLLAAAALTGSLLLAVGTTGTASAATKSATPAASTTTESAVTTAVRAPISAALARKPLARSLATASALDKSGGDPRVTAYWTQKRLASAIDLDTPTASATVQRNVAKLQAAAEVKAKVLARPVATTVKSNRLRIATAPVTNFSATNGKVFFTDPADGKWYMCSGSAVNSGSKRLVVTAGHCVYNADSKKWMTNWQFIPGYYKGSRPRGTFQAAVMRTYNDWMNWGTSWTGIGWNSDVGFVTTYSNANGQKVVNAVGGHGLYYGGSMNFDVSVFGYPGNLNSGEVMWACWGSTGTQWIGFYQEPKISGCNFGGGASGGPWLYNYSNATGLGYVRSVTSNSPSKTDFSSIGGPYFDSRILGLYNAANGDGLW